MRSVVMMMHEATALMRRRFEKAARPEKLTLMQWRFLGVVSRNHDMRQVDLVAATKASPMTVSDVAERLEAAGLIKRVAAPEDSRAKIVSLTPAGEDKVAVMRDISAGVFSEVFEGVSEEDVAMLKRVLPQIIRNLGGSTPSDQD